MSKTEQTENTETLLAAGGKRMTVTMEIVAPPGATVGEVHDYLYELECAGGCRDAQEDVMFDSIGIISSIVKVKR